MDVEVEVEMEMGFPLPFRPEIGTSSLDGTEMALPTCQPCRFRQSVDIAVLHRLYFVQYVPRVMVRQGVASTVHYHPHILIRPAAYSTGTGAVQAQAQAQATQNTIA